MASRQQQINNWKYAPYLYVLVALTSIAFLFAIFTVNLREYNAGYKLFLSLTIAIPELFIWYVATRGAVKFKSYANTIRKSKDGAALDDIANALLWITGYIILLISGAAFARIFSQGLSYEVAINIYNHLPLLFAVIGSVLLYLGAKKLNQLVSFNISPAHRSMFWLGGTLLSIIFIANFVQSAQEATFGNDHEARFVAPVEVLIFTYVLPHIVAWTLGAYAALSLLNYSLHVRGEIYKRFFRQLFWGLMLVFTGTFLAQLLILAGVHSENFNPLLVFTYGVLLLGVYGFILIYRGANKLQQIENI